MNFDWVLICCIGMFSLFIGYRIYIKIRNKTNGEKDGVLGKFLAFFLISLISISIYLITFVLAYSFIWEKTYRSYAELKFEATVIGYKKELVKTQSFKGSSYYDRPVFFPKVKYINNQGEEVIKTLDITTNNIIPIGESIVITDSKYQKNANLLDLNWLMLITASFFTGISAFFLFFFTSYLSHYEIKKRILISFYFAVGFTCFNLICLILIYLKV